MVGRAYISPQKMAAEDEGHYNTHTGQLTGVLGFPFYDTTASTVSLSWEPRRDTKILFLANRIIRP